MLEPLPQHDGPAVLAPGALAVPTAELVLAPGADRDTWLAARTLGIGGSDAAALLGRSPYRTAAGVFLDKLGRGRQLEDTELMFWGRALEDAIADTWSAATGVPTWKTGTYAHRERPWQRANPDRLCPHGGVEIKTADRAQRHHWDRELTPLGVPFHYLCQVQHYMAVTGLPMFWVVCLIGGNHLVVRKIDADPDDMAALTGLEYRFWHEHVLTGRPPLVTARDAENMTPLYPRPDPDSIIELPADIVAKVKRHKEVKAALAALEGECTALEVAIKTALGNKVVGTEDGTPIVSWKSTKRLSGDGTPVRTLRNTYGREPRHGRDRGRRRPARPAAGAGAGRAAGADAG